MLILHVSDLHLGRMMDGYALDDDQAHVLDEIIATVVARSVRFLVIAGDIYDHALPSARAIRLFESFLTRLSRLPGLDTFIISGNHDDATRLGYAAFALSAYHIHVVASVRDALSPLDFPAENLSFILLPYFYGDDFAVLPDGRGLLAEEGYARLIERALAAVPAGRRPIAVCHQYITGGITSASERSAALIANSSLSLSLFKPFALTMLGHLHKAQSFSGANVHYCGSPLVYDVKEIGNRPRMNLYDETLSLTETVPFTPLRPVVRIKGSWSVVTAPDAVARHQDDYVHVLLEGDDIPLSAERTLKANYPFFLRADRVDTHASALSTCTEALPTDKMELFKAFYRHVLGQEMTSAEEEIIKETLADSEEDDV